MRKIPIRNRAVCLWCGTVAESRKHSRRSRCACGSLTVSGGVAYRERVFTRFGDGDVAFNDLNGPDGINPYVEGQGDPPWRSPTGSYVFLEDWRSILVDGNVHLVGHAFGHRRIRWRGRAITSAVREITADQRWALTQNTVYVLGDAGAGPLPPSWARAVDRFLDIRWRTGRQKPS